MSVNLFQIAASRAQNSCLPDEWQRLDLTEQSNAIYRELRRLDQAALRDEETLSVRPGTLRVI